MREGYAKGFYDLVTRTKRPAGGQLTPENFPNEELRESADYQLITSPIPAGLKRQDIQSRVVERGLTLAGVADGLRYLWRDHKIDPDTDVHVLGSSEPPAYRSIILSADRISVKQNPDDNAYGAGAILARIPALNPRLVVLGLSLVGSILHKKSPYNFQLRFGTGGCEVATSFAHEVLLVPGATGVHLNGVDHIPEPDAPIIDLK